MTDNEKDYLRKVGKKVAVLRKERGFSQLDICAKINMDKPNLSSIENGRQNFTTLTLKKIADAIGVQVFEFFDF